jgi:hypothetical protein
MAPGRRRLAAGACSPPSARFGLGRLGGRPVGDMGKCSTPTPQFLGIPVAPVHSLTCLAVVGIFEEGTVNHLVDLAITTSSGVRELA